MNDGIVSQHKLTVVNEKAVRSCPLNFLYILVDASVVFVRVFFTVARASYSIGWVIIQRKE